MKLKAALIVVAVMLLGRGMVSGLSQSGDRDRLLLHALPGHRLQELKL